jgi:hypothetical protein
MGLLLFYFFLRYFVFSNPLTAPPPPVSLCILFSAALLLIYCFITWFYCFTQPFIFFVFFAFHILPLRLSTSPVLLRATHSHSATELPLVRSQLLPLSSVSYIIADAFSAVLFLYHEHGITSQMTEICGGNGSLWWLSYHLNCRNTPAVFNLMLFLRSDSIFVIIVGL